MNGGMRNEAFLLLHWLISTRRKLGFLVATLSYMYNTYSSVEK